MLLFAIDLRGKEYDESYFDDALTPSLFALAFGYFSLIFVFCAYNDKKKFLQKLIHKIVNIGIDTKIEETDE